MVIHRMHLDHIKFYGMLIILNGLSEVWSDGASNWKVKFRTCLSTSE
jgi:hypothetical protein